MFTKFLVAAAALTAAVAVSAPAQAGTDINIGLGVGLGFGGGYHGGGYYDPGYYPVYGGGYDGISCHKAKKIVKSHGFKNVYATKCGGKIMRFNGMKWGDHYTVKVNRWGTIVDIDHL